MSTLTVAGGFMEGPPPPADPPPSSAAAACHNQSAKNSRHAAECSTLYLHDGFLEEKIGLMREVGAQHHEKGLIFLMDERSSTTLPADRRMRPRLTAACSWALLLP